MEKINALIEKLQELKNSGADLPTISYYAQLLQAEVLHARNKLHQQQVQSSQGNIAVIMPSQPPVSISMPAATASQTTTLPSNKPLETPVAAPVASATQEEVNIRAARLNDVPTHNTIIISEDINTRAARAAEIAASSSMQVEVPTQRMARPVETKPVETFKPEVPTQVVPKPVETFKPEVPTQEAPKPVELPNYQRAAASTPVELPKPVETPEASEAPITPAVPAATPREIPMAEVPPAADLVPPKPEPIVTAQPIPTLAANRPLAEKPKPAATLFDEVPAAKENAAATNGALRKDLNDLVGNSGLSLNDRLRQQQVEVAQKLGEMPINDLRLAIGLNEKYQFIQELFRGDRDLYERSIKTINECSNLQEADYWIQREIKIIQGWEDDHHLVQHFYSLLKKRFS